jgi:hypothetical protein
MDEFGSSVEPPAQDAGTDGCGHAYLESVGRGELAGTTERERLTFRFGFDAALRMASSEIRKHLTGGWRGVPDATCALSEKVLALSGTVMNQTPGPSEQGDDDEIAQADLEQDEDDGGDEE